MTDPSPVGALGSRLGFLGTATLRPVQAGGFSFLGGCDAATLPAKGDSVGVLHLFFPVFRAMSLCCAHSSRPEPIRTASLYRRPHWAVDLSGSVIVALQRKNGSASRKILRRFVVGMVER